MRLTDGDPPVSALAEAVGVGEGGLHPQFRAEVGGRKVIVDALELLERLDRDGLLRGEAARPLLGARSVGDLEALVTPIAENVEALILRLDSLLPEATAELRLVGQGWFRLRREEGEPLQNWLLQADEEQGHVYLAHALLGHLRRHDLAALEVSEQNPSAVREGLWTEVSALAPQLREPRPSPEARLARGIMALLEGHPLEAERELGASSMGGEARAARWLALAHGAALHTQRPEPRYITAPRAAPSPELLAKLALERPTEVGGPAVSPWRVRVLLAVALIGALLLWSLQRSFQSTIRGLQQTEIDLDGP